MKGGGEVSNERWYKYNFNQLEMMLKTDLQNGLTVKEAKRRSKKYRKNELFPRAASENKGKEKTHLGSVTILLVIVSVIYYFVSRDVSAFFICILAAINYFAVLLAYRKSEMIILQSEKYADPENRVIRDGKVYRINQKAVVPGDVVILREGDIVPCDGRILSLDSFKVLEMNISGGNGEKDESFISYDPSLPVNYQKNMLFAASIVFKGEAIMVACETGENTVARRRNLTSKPAPADNLEIFRMAKKLSHIVGSAMLVLVFVLSLCCILAYGLSDRMTHGFVLSLALAASAMTEFYVAFAYISVAYGIFFVPGKNSDFNENVIFKNISSVDRMNKLTCLAIPKTSGVCEDKMALEKIFVNGREYSGSDDHIKTERLRELASLTVENKKELSSEEKAIFDCFSADEQKYSVLEFLPLGEFSPLDTSLVLGNEGLLVVLRGGVEEILGRCSTRLCANGEAELESEIAYDYSQKAEEYERHGYKVVAIASKKTIYGNLQKIIYAQSKLCFEGFLIMREPIVNGCAETVKTLTGSGIKVLLFCDDISGRNESLARSLGIIKDQSQIITAYEFVNSNLNLQNIKLKNYRLFQGFDGKQKKYILDRLMKSGEQIGILGSTLTDVSLTVGSSVVSFSTGTSLTRSKRETGVRITPHTASGNEALKLRADAIIQSAQSNKKSGINAVFDAIKISDTVYDNCGNIIQYLLASLITRLVLVVLSVFTTLVALTPAQVIFSGLVVDLCAIFAISSSKSDQPLLNKKNSFTLLKTDPFPLIISDVLLAVYGCLLLVVTRCILMINGIGQQSSDGCIFMAYILCQLVYAFVVYSRGKKQALQSMGKLLWLFALAVIELFLLSILWEELAVFLSFGIDRLVLFFVALIPPILLTLTHSIPYLNKLTELIFERKSKK